MTTIPLPNQTFFESYAEAVLLIKEDNTPVFVNPAFTKLSGFDKNNLHLINLPGLFHKPQNDNPENIKWETGLVRNDSSVVSVTVSVSPIIFSDQSEGKIYTVTNNSTLERTRGLLRESEKRLGKTKSELEMLNKELTRSNEELEQFIYVASHDLQQPLRMITSYIQLVQSKIEGGSAKNVNEFMKFIVEGSETMQSLINALLNYSRLSTKANNLTECDLNELVSVATTRLADQIKQSDAKITIDNLPRVKVDSSQIVSLFQHVLENAIKFKSPERKPEIKISVEEKGPDYLFSVKDNGIGIDDKNFDRIFIIFQRLHSPAEYKGTGIGLAMAKKIVERHGGEMWVESEVGKGSTFYFTLKK